MEGGGGGAKPNHIFHDLMAFNYDNIAVLDFSFLTRKEKHFLTRKLVGYKIGGQEWCKKEGNKVLGKET